jgi:hypothetical protein
LFSEYMLTFRAEEPMKICVKTKFVIYNQITDADKACRSSEISVDLIKRVVLNIWMWSRGQGRWT